MKPRTHLYISAEQQAKIDAAAKRSGSTKSEVIRRSLDSYLLDHGDCYTPSGDIDEFVVANILSDAGLTQHNAKTAARVLYELVRNQRLAAIHS